MAKHSLSSSTLLISGIVAVFMIIIGIIFFITYKLGQSTAVNSEQQIITASRESENNFDQVRRVKLTHQDTGESMEIFMDGTVKYYDKSGKLIKTGRRGFAETQYLLRRYEWLVNNHSDLASGDYYVEIETQKGTTTYNPGQPGSGNGSGDLIDDTVDFVDETINPTPRPSPSVSPSALPTTLPTPSPLPSPTPLPDKPDYLNAPPFNCNDYYQTGGKPLKISNTYCGIE